MRIISRSTASSTGFANGFQRRPSDSTLDLLESAVNSGSTVPLYEIRKGFGTITLSEPVMVEVLEENGSWTIASSDPGIAGGGISLKSAYKDYSGAFLCGAEVFYYSEDCIHDSTYRAYRRCLEGF